MRKTLALASLGVAVAATLLPVTSASAYADPILSEVFTRCTNACVETARAYHAADARSGDRLPDVEFLCPA